MSEIQYFLKIDGIDGESQDVRHKSEIELESWSWGESQDFGVSGSSGGAGKVKIQDFQFSMRLNKASPQLLLAGATGEHIGKATLTARKGFESAVEFLHITLSDILVSSFQTSAALEDGLPRDWVSFSFSKIEYEYKPQKLDGSLDAGIKVSWDVKANNG